MDTPTKRCTKCGQEFPATLEHFYKRNDGRFGLHAQCKACVSKREHRRYLAHQEEIKERVRQYGKSHQNEIVLAHRRYEQENAEKIAERRKRYRLEHREEINQQLRHYYQKHPEKVNERKEYGRRWRINNSEKRRASKEQRRARQLGAKGTHTAKDIALQIRVQTNSKGRLICWWCGCEISGKYHVDHRIALARGGSNAAENLVIACPHCNTSKQDKLPGEFNGRLL